MTKQIPKAALQVALPISLLIGGYALIPKGLQAHGGEDHKKSAKVERTRTESEAQDQNASHFSMDQFATLHPLVIHFPIVLLLFAPVLWLLGMSLSRVDFYYIAFGAALPGLVGAYVAGNFVHPHTTELPVAAQAVLDAHDFWADLTIFSASASLLVMGMSLRLKKFIKPLQVLALAVLVFAAVSVSLTGHYGALLTHVHGVGPQGKYLEIHEH